MDKVIVTGLLIVASITGAVITINVMDVGLNRNSAASVQAQRDAVRRIQSGITIITIGSAGSGSTIHFWLKGSGSTGIQPLSSLDVFLRRVDGTSGGHIPYSAAGGAGTWTTVPAADTLLSPRGTLRIQVSLANPLTPGIHMLSVVTPEGTKDDYLFSMVTKPFEAGPVLDHSWRAGGGGSGGGGVNSGSLSKFVAKDARENIGVIPAGISKLSINLTAENDLDIELWDGATFVVGWRTVGGVKAIIYSATEITRMYNGVLITWSGWDGINSNPGNEFIQIDGVTQNEFVMKVFGYQAGSVQVDYTWD